MIAVSAGRRKPPRCFFDDMEIPPKALRLNCFGRVSYTFAEKILTYFEFKVNYLPRMKHKYAKCVDRRG